MSDLLWQKPGVAVDAEIQAFLAGDDVLLDREFFLHDIAASRAHAQGLERIGMLSAEELAGLERELTTLADDFRSGAFVLDNRYEDGHSAIEARLTERLGDAGRHHVDLGGFTLSEDGHRLVVVATEDNLLKGAATQALQNLNLAFGFKEFEGIPA